MNPLQDPEDRDEATRLINQYAASDWCDISFSIHAFNRQEQRAISNALMMVVLREGVVDDIEVKIVGNRLRHSYRLSVVDQWGRVSVVTAIPGFQKLHIVTMYIA